MPLLAQQASFSSIMEPQYPLRCRNCVQQNYFSFLVLGALVKLRKAAISFFMSVGVSVRPHGTTRFPLDGFSKKLIFSISRKSV
jgi:hypothetical protein